MLYIDSFSRFLGGEGSLDFWAAKGGRNAPKDGRSAAKGDRNAAKCGGSANCLEFLGKGLRTCDLWTTSQVTAAMAETDWPQHLPHVRVRVLPCPCYLVNICSAGLP